MNKFNEWKNSYRPIYYIDHTGEFRCELELSDIIKIAEKNINTDKHCRIGVVDFECDVKEKFSSFKEVESLVAEQLDKCTFDKSMDVCLYNSERFDSRTQKTAKLTRLNNTKPEEKDFWDFRQFYVWKKGTSPIFYAYNDGQCWALYNFEKIKENCIRDIQDGARSVEIRIRNYDKKTRLKLNTLEDICNLSFNNVCDPSITPNVDDTIFSAKFHNKYREDKPFMSRKEAISCIKRMSEKSCWQPDRNANNFPKELNISDAFMSTKDCVEWLKDFGYNPEDFNIVRYNYNDIKGLTVIVKNTDKDTECSNNKWCHESITYLRVDRYPNTAKKSEGIPNKTIYVLISPDLLESDSKENENYIFNQCNSLMKSNHENLKLTVCDKNQYETQRKRHKSICLIYGCKSLHLAYDLLSLNSSL